MYKIIIVEDDRTIAEGMAAKLRKWDYEVVVASDFERVAEFVREEAGHLVLLDISLPYLTGYHWCNEIRKFSNIPIIFVSSHSERMDLLMAMNMGGDDFVTKPFDMDILIAKVQALIRRTYAYSKEMDVLTAAGVFLHPEEGKVSYDGKEIELTRNENRILTLLMQSKGRTVSRAKIMKRLWESDSFIDENTLSVNVNRLRAKLEEIGIKDFIRTKKGEGYAVHDEDLPPV